MSKTLDLRVLRVGETCYTGEAVSVSLSAGDGMVTILPDHEPFISSIRPCTVRAVDINGGEHRIETNGGVVEVVQNTCTLLL